MKPLVSGTIAFGLMATACLGLWHRSTEVSRRDAVVALASRLEAARLASPVTREAPYGETVQGSAWEHYLKALAIVESIADHRSRCRLLVEGRTHKDRLAGLELLDEARGVFSHLKRGAHSRDATRPCHSAHPGDTRLLRLDRSRAMGQLVYANVARLIAEGRHGDAVESMLDMQQFAADVMMSPFLIEEMIGCSLLAPAEVACTPAPGGRSLSDEAKLDWFAGTRGIQDGLSMVGRSYSGELEFLARALLHPRDRREADWGDELPSWRFGFSWEEAAADFVLGMDGQWSAYCRAMVAPDGLPRLAGMDAAWQASGNPAAQRLWYNSRSAAESRRMAFMRLELVIRALALDLGEPTRERDHPWLDPVAVKINGRSVHATYEAPGGLVVRFGLLP